MDNLTPVEGKKGLYRDNDTTAIVNRDKSGYQSYIARKQVMDNKNLELNKMKEDLEEELDVVIKQKNELMQIVQGLYLL